MISFCCCFSLPLFACLFPYETKKGNGTSLLSYCVCVCVCISPRDLTDVRVVKRKREKWKNKEDGIPCVFILSNFLLTFSLYELICCVLFLCHRMFPYFVYKAIVCTYQLFITCCVHAYSSFILFCFFFLSSLTILPLIYSQLKERNRFFFVLISTLLLYLCASWWILDDSVFLGMSVCVLMIVTWKKDKYQRLFFFFKFLFQQKDNIEFI